MRIVIAPQELKGSLTAADAARAIADGLARVLPDAVLDLVPMADGGPGTVDALLSARGGEPRITTVHGPLGEPVEAGWARLSDGTAVIEMASCAGLSLLEPARRDPMRTTTYGCGQLLLAALDAGCSEVIFGMGGSATVDGGAGLAEALGYRLLDRHGRRLPPGGGMLHRLERIDAAGAEPRPRRARVLVACDVDAPLLGEHGAARAFGPQKGADPLRVARLDWGLARLAAVIRRDLGVDVAPLPGSGAAGGLAAGLVAFAGGELRPGGPLIAEALRLAEHLHGAGACITGEGRLDSGTAMGKAVAIVAAAAARAGVPCHALVGSIGDSLLAAALGLASVEAIAPPGLPWDEARARAASLLTGAAERLGRALAPGGRQGGPRSGTMPVVEGE